MASALQTLTDTRIITALEDKDPVVRCSAIFSLRDNHPYVLAEQNAQLIVPMLSDESCIVRWHVVNALGTLKPHVLVKYADDISRMLADTDEFVRGDAMTLLGRLEPRVLEKYADQVVPMLSDESSRVRKVAVHTLVIMLVKMLAKLDPDVLARYMECVVAKLGDESEKVRLLVQVVLGNLEQRVLMVALVPHRYALQALQSNDKVADKFRSLRGRVWLVRWRQLFWCQRLLWYWGSLACRPGSMQARAEEEGEREVKRARVE